MKHSKLVGVISTTTIFASFLVVGTSTASAHTVLVSSNPTKGSKVKALPKKLVLNFAEPLLTIKGKEVDQISVTDSQNRELVTGSSLVSGTQVSAALSSGGTTTGKIHVDYRVVAQDGHVVTGGFDFSVIKK
jgi:methionine-rich copper-binding protein CopC